MTFDELRQIALHAAKGTVPACYANNDVDVNAAFVDGLRELAGSYLDFQKNRYDIYKIMVEVADEIVPKKVIDAMGAFAEVRQVAQGEKAIFRKKVGKNRARMFLTQVGLSGVYETFRLDETTFEVKAHAIGGGATIDFERMLDGAETLADVMEVITEGLTDAIYLEVQKALVAAFSASDRPAANKYTANTFTASEMVKLISTVRSYGNGVAIFATPEFIGAMGADVIVSGQNPGIAADDIDSIHRTGYIKIFRGAPVIELPQSFTDETNAHTWINPQYAYILPTGGEKVVKVVLEGATQIHDFTNRDNSMEVYAYKKMGAAIFCNYNWAIYQNTGITDTSVNPYGI